VGLVVDTRDVMERFAAGTGCEVVAA